MYKKSFFLLLGLIFLPLTLISEIRIICTAAIVSTSDNNYEFRKQQYDHSFKKLVEFGYSNFYIVEALCSKRPDFTGKTFLEDYSPNVFYATVNNPTLRNQGINEAKTLMEACEFFGFDDNDIIIKLTGRHAFFSDHFFTFVKENQHADAWVKFNPEMTGVFTLAFAMRYKYMKDMYSKINYDHINTYMIPIEHSVANYIKDSLQYGSMHVLTVHQLGIKTDIFGSTVTPGVASQVLTY